MGEADNALTDSAQQYQIAKIYRNRYAIVFYILIILVNTNILSLHEVSSNNFINL
jgi:hypothetical protein